MTQGRIKRLACLLAILIIPWNVWGCDRLVAPQATPEMAVIMTAEPTATLPAGTPEPIQTPEPKGDALEAARLFHALDLSVFQTHVTSDGYTLHRSLKAPEAYGITVTPQMYTWGDFTEQAAQVQMAQHAENLSQLEAIDRELLPERSQLAYDVLEQYLQSAVAGEPYYGYYEPLEQTVGIQVQLPLVLGLYRIESAEDIESYLALLADMPRYFAQALAYEQQRAEMQMFMTQDALSAIVSDCNAVINHAKDFFLLATFHDAISEIDGLTRAEKRAYDERNAAAIAESLIPAFTSLRDGLQALSASCRPAEGVYAQGEKALAYYALRLQEETGTLLTPEDAVALLEPAMQDMFVTMQTIYAEDPAVAAGKAELGSGSVKKDMDYLQTVAKSFLPELPEHEVSFVEVPEELEQQMTAAGYAIPPIDAGSDNTILINTAKTDTASLLTLAHEGYPGHLYQYVYQRSIEDLGLMQQALTFGGYTEGWAQMAEEWAILEQTKYDQNAGMFAFCNSVLSNAILPSIVSIYVNYYGYERDDVRDYLNQYGLGDDSYTDLYFNLAVNRPYGTLRYAVGYAQLSELLRDMSETLGEAYLQQEVLVQYLQYGPAYFNLLRERMDEWADAKILE